jgi:RNA polymerase sigma-70 factor (ECF subfamily)
MQPIGTWPRTFVRLHTAKPHGEFHMGEPPSLSRILLARLGAQSARELAPSAESIESALRRADAEGRTAWPDVPLEPEVFAAHIADRVRGRPEVAGAIATLHAADLFLACACSNAIPAALAELERVHLSCVPRLVRRIDRSRAFADEVSQSIREAFLVRRDGAPSRIAEYSGRGALSSWIRVVAVRTALRLRHEQRRATLPLDAGSEEALPGVVDPELDYLKLRYGRVYEEAIRAALGSLSDRDALLLKLNYLEGLNIDRIGALFGVDRSTVARWRARILAALLANMREFLERRVSLTASQFDSLLALVRSQLSVSIRSALHRPLDGER